MPVQFFMSSPNSYQASLRVLSLSLVGFIGMLESDLGKLLIVAASTTNTTLDFRMDRGRSVYLIPEHPSTHARRAAPSHRRRVPPSDTVPVP
jgi:hypothetical protein